MTHVQIWAHRWIARPVVSRTVLDGATDAAAAGHALTTAGGHFDLRKPLGEDVDLTVGLLDLRLVIGVLGLVGLHLCSSLPFDLLELDV